MAGAILVLLTLGTAAPLAAQPADLLLREGRFHSMGEAGTVSGDLAIREGRIVALGAAATRLRGGATIVIELAGRTVIPGLLDAELPLAAGLDLALPPAAQARVLLGAMARANRAGLTSIAEPEAGTTALLYRALRDDGESTLRIHLLWRGDSLAETERGVHAQQHFNNDPMLRIAGLLLPWQPAPGAEARAALRLAEASRLPLRIQPEAMPPAATVLATPQRSRLLVLAHPLRGEALPAFATGAVLRPAAATPGTLAALRAARLPAGLGTANPRHAPDPLGVLAGLVAAGLSPAEALALLTSGNAAVLGIADEVGSLEPGKFADLVVLSDDVLARPERLGETRALLTMLAGRVVHRAPGF